MRLIRIRQGTTTIVANFLLQTVTAQELSGATTSIRARRPDQSLDDVAMNQLIGFIRAIQRRDAGTVAASEVLTTLRTANRVLNAALLRAEAHAPLTGVLGRRFRAADKLGGSPSV